MLHSLFPKATRLGGRRARLLDPAAGSSSLRGLPRRRRGDQSGGAISLWVVLMVPVAGFAAVVAMAGPQRLAAESSVEEAADDLASLAVALRDGRDDPDFEIEGFIPDCPRISLPTGYSSLPSPEQQRLANQQVGLEKVCNLLLGDDATSAEGYLHRDLGNLGINTSSWTGFYSDSVAPAPCRLSDTLATHDAVYVALAADWGNAGWAAAQAWPDGVRLGAEVVARLNRDVSSGKTRIPTSKLCGGEPQAPPDSDPALTFFSD